MEKRRELWIDYIKVFACVLVVLGHFFQSMTKSNILPENDLYKWFNTTIYYFHVPLFFICSGYLYQKFSKVDSVNSWKKNVLKKLVALGIPYFAFSTVTWGLKTIFSGSVNDQLGGIVETLFFNPTSPYWYLYCLFFLFLVTPTIVGKKTAMVVIAFSVVGKALILSGRRYGFYAISIVFTNEIWFVAGMLLYLCSKYLDRIKKYIGLFVVAIFIALSVFVYSKEINSGYISFSLGCLACIGFISLFYAGEIENAFLSFLAKYTMPIFLMHTIFAALMRSVLMKIGIRNALVHVVMGLAISFIGPIVAAEIMKNFTWLEIFLYPGKYIKLK